MAAPRWVSHRCPPGGTIPNPVPQYHTVLRPQGLVVADIPFPPPPNTTGEKPSVYELQTIRAQPQVNNHPAIVSHTINPNTLANRPQARDANCKTKHGAAPSRTCDQCMDREGPRPYIICRIDQRKNNTCNNCGQQGYACKFHMRITARIQLTFAGSFGGIPTDIAVQKGTISFGVPQDHGDGTTSQRAETSAPGSPILDDGDQSVFESPSETRGRSPSVTSGGGTYNIVRELERALTGSPNHPVNLPIGNTATQHLFGNMMQGIANAWQQIIADNGPIIHYMRRNLPPHLRSQNLDFRDATIGEVQAALLRFFAIPDTFRSPYANIAWNRITEEGPGVAGMGARHHLVALEDLIRHYYAESQRFTQPLRPQPSPGRGRNPSQSSQRSTGQSTTHSRSGSNVQVVLPSRGAPQGMPRSGSQPQGLSRSGSQPQGFTTGDRRSSQGQGSPSQHQGSPPQHQGPPPQSQQQQTRPGSQPPQSSSANPPQSGAPRTPDPRFQGIHKRFPSSGSGS